jgi:stringent starvation protein B
MAMFDAMESSSTRPYLIRALYEWCTDNGFTPYVAVSVDDTVLVPREFVKNGEIVLNISFDATSSLKLGNDAIEFKARFSGVAREIMVPINRVMAVYARENGQGMAFPMAGPGGVLPDAAAIESIREPGKAPLLTRVPSTVSGIDSDGRAVSMPQATTSQDDGEDPTPPRPPSSVRPALKRVK